MTTLNREDALSVARAHMVTASTKKKPKNRSLYLKRSVTSALDFIDANPLTKKWGLVTILSNTGRSILSGLEDDVEIPAEDVAQWSEMVDDFDDMYNEFLRHSKADADAETALRNSQSVRRSEVNKQLRVHTPSMGLKALAIVSMDLLGSSDPTPEEDDYQTHASIKDDEYKLLEGQLNHLDSYLAKTRQMLPSGYDERFVVARQPVLIAGTARYNPTANAKRYVAREGVELDGYYVLKNQIVLGVTRDLNKVVNSREYRRRVELRLRDIYQHDLEKKLKKARNDSQKLKLMTDMERDLAEDVKREVAEASRPVNLNTVVKALSKQLGVNLTIMEGTSSVKNSPYVYYWLISSDIYENVVYGLYSDVTNWDLPYK